MPIGMFPEDRDCQAGMCSAVTPPDICPPAAAAAAAIAAAGVVRTPPWGLMLGLRAYGLPSQELGLEAEAAAPSPGTLFPSSALFRSAHRSSTSSTPHAYRISESLMPMTAHSATASCSAQIRSIQTFGAQGRQVIGLVGDNLHLREEPRIDLGGIENSLHAQSSAKCGRNQKEAIRCWDIACHQQFVVAESHRCRLFPSCHQAIPALLE